MGCDSHFIRMGTPCISELLLQPKQDLLRSRQMPGKVGGAWKLGAFPLVETEFLSFRGRKLTKGEYDIS